MNFYKIPILLLIICIILSCSGSPISTIEPVKINLENKQKLLLMPYDILNKNVFERDESYKYLSDYLTDKMNIWLTDTNGFNVTNLTDAVPEPEFDFNYAYISENNIYKALLAYANVNDYDLIVYPVYKIESTTDSTETNKILYLEIKLFGYNVKYENVEYINKKTIISGIDVSLYQGVTSIINNSDNPNQISNEELIEQEKNIADKTKTAFDIIIGEISNDYTLFIKDRLNNPDSSEDDSINNSENSNNNGTSNSNDEDSSNSNDSSNN